MRSTAFPSIIVNADNAGIERTARVIADGGLVAFPTETVYGLGANARDDHAVALIFEAKNRPRFNPLIVHVPTMEDARRLAEFDDRAEEIANAFWPGPLSIVLPRRADTGLSFLVSAGLNTIALRMPDNELAEKLLTEAQCPIAAPSATLAAIGSDGRSDGSSNSNGNRVDNGVPIDDRPAALYAFPDPYECWGACWWQLIYGVWDLLCLPFLLLAALTCIRGWAFWRECE